MSDQIVIQSPATPDRLVLLFHGVGSTPENLVPLGQRLAAAMPAATVISVQSPDRCDIGAGWQWFSVLGITEENRRERVTATMDRFVHTVRDLQARNGLTALQTTLVGFSQGVIMALESTLLADAPAGRVASLAARFVELPKHAPASTVVNLLHGEQDTVINPAWSTSAAQRLQSLGAEVTCDVVRNLGHGINDETVGKLLQQLATGTPLER